MFMIPKHINDIVYKKDFIFKNEPASNSNDEYEKKNLQGFRSDNFKNNNINLHILFNGCSNTEGYGLLLEETWSKKLYNKIFEKEKCEDYYNIAISVSSVMNQVITFFKYFKMYGNPDVIFYNITDNFRFYIYDKEEYKNAFYSRQDVPLINLICYQYYFMLEQYCKSNNIKLFSFTWVDGEEEYIKILNNFDTFYKIDRNKMLSYVYEYKEKNKNESFCKYIELARDGEHPGIGINDYWANFMYEKYIEHK